MQLRWLGSWWHRRRAEPQLREPPQHRYHPSMLPPPAPVVPVGPSDQEALDLDWAQTLDRRFAEISEAQLNLKAVLRELDVHVERYHHGEIQHCDLWCWPRMVRRMLIDMPPRDQTVFHMIVLKDWYWRQATMNAWMEDDSGKSQNQD